MVSDSGAQHVDAAEEGEGVPFLRRDLLLHAEGDIVEADTGAEIVGLAAEDKRGRMAVAIDEPRQHRLPASLDDTSRGPAFRRLPWPGIDDAVLNDRHLALPNDRQAVAHRVEIIRPNEQIDCSHRDVPSAAGFFYACSPPLAWQHSRSGSIHAADRHGRFTSHA